MFNLILNTMLSKELEILENELLEIKKSSEKIGTFLKGLTGQQSYLSEHDWLFVRTNGFK